MINYDHSCNIHSVEGPRAAFPAIFRNAIPSSLLDVGCGTGTWLRAAMECGVQDIIGVDGVAVPSEHLLVPGTCFLVRDLTRQWDLGRRFDAALCLEVAEHIDESHAEALLETLTRHSDIIIFSAACPGQEGQHHVNCQWPAYWQKLFNERSYACSDELRWQIWDEARIEPWYRQNIFIARRDTVSSGNEPRIKAVLHPEMLPSILTGNAHYLRKIDDGSMTARWYLETPVRALSEKLKKHLS